MYTNGTYVLKDLKTGSRFPLLSKTLHSQTDCSVENMSGKKGKDMCDFLKIFFGLIFPKWSLLFLFCLRVTYSCWRRKWQPTPMFLLGESQGRGSLVGCRLWGHTESDTRRSDLAAAAAAAIYWWNWPKGVSELGLFSTVSHELGGKHQTENFLACCCWGALRGLISVMIWGR